MHPVEPNLQFLYELSKLGSSWNVMFVVH